MPEATWGDLATTILASAVGSGVDADRKFVSVGPTFARDCRMIVAHFDAVAPVPGQGEFAGTPWSVEQYTFRVVFYDPCSITVDDDGDPIPDAEVDAMSVAFLNDAGMIHAAVSADADTFCECESVTVGRGQTKGPSGGFEFGFPITMTPVS